MNKESWKQKIGIEMNEVSFKEKLISAAGGVLAILLLIFLTRLCLHGLAGAFVMASMGASAVLIFAVPHGQLSQPWPVVAGHTLSALTGIICARFIPQADLAAASAVGLAIGVMHVCKCIHPPGGATALTAVIGGQAVQDLGFGFMLCPVLTNALMMTALGVAINAAFPWRRYPAFLTRRLAPAAAHTPTHEEVAAAVKSLDSFVDITEEDLIRLCQMLAPKFQQDRFAVEPATQAPARLTNKTDKTKTRLATSGVPR